MKPLESRAAGTEAAIETKEHQLEALNSAIVEAGRAKRGQEIIEISRTMHTLKEDIEALYRKLDAQSEEIRRVKSRYDKELEGAAE